MKPQYGENWAQSQYFSFQLVREALPGNALILAPICCDRGDKWNMQWISFPFLFEIEVHTKLFSIFSLFFFFKIVYCELDV